MLCITAVVLLITRRLRDAAATLIRLFFSLDPNCPSNQHVNCKYDQRSETDPRMEPTNQSAEVFVAGVIEAVSAYNQKKVNKNDAQAGSSVLFHSPTNLGMIEEVAKENQRDHRGCSMDFHEQAGEMVPGDRRV